MPSEVVDGNDVEAVYTVTKAAVERARNGGGPALIEAKTMRMMGHAIHDPADYVPRELLAEWEKRDPVHGYAERLLATMPQILDLCVTERSAKYGLGWIEPELMQKTMDITFANNKPEKALAVNDVFTNQFSSKIKP